MSATSAFAASVRRDVGNILLCIELRSVKVDYHQRAFTCQPARDGGADAARATGDQNAFAFESLHHSSLTVRLGCYSAPAAIRARSI
jgi:hypothetical protein